MIHETKILYWKPELEVAHSHASLELRATMAFDLLKNNSILMARPAGEDTRGRQAMEVMPPQELVDRALAIAEAFVSRCEERGYITLPTLSPEAVAAEAGRLERIKSNKAWATKEAA